MNRIAGGKSMTAVVLFLSILFLLRPLTGARAESQRVTDTGTVLQFVLPGLALGSTFIAGNSDGGLWDREGTKQAVLSIGTTAGIVATGKGAARKLRPDGSDRNSFPSGHTSASFSGASFIGTRYGWRWGIPAYAAATFVGYSRYQANQHYADDILAGASIAMLSNWIWTHPMHERFTLLPMAADNTVVGVQLVGTLGGDSKGKIAAKADPFAKPTPPDYRFQFQFGPGYVKENKVKSNGGNDFDMSTLQENDNPLTTAHLTFEVFLGERHTLNFAIWPMEAKDRGTLTSPVTYLGKTFPANTVIDSDWLLFDTRVGYHYNFTPKDPFIISAGPGLMMQFHKIKLSTSNGTIGAEEDDVVLVPFLSAKLGYRFTEKLSFYVEVDGGYLSNAWMADTKAVLKYRLTQNWDFSAGYEHYARDIEGHDIQNRIVQRLPYLGVAYSW